MTSTRTIAKRTSRSALNPCARSQRGNSKCPPFLADAGGRMKVVHRKDAKALKGDKSLSYQIITPDKVGSRKFLITVVDIRPGGSTPVHDTAIYFPAGSTHGIRNVGRGRLRYLSCHAPPYEIEDLYRSWQAPEALVTTGG